MRVHETLTRGSRRTGAVAPSDQDGPEDLAELERARSVAVEAVEEAGQLLLARVTGSLGVRTKSATGDIVTDLDLAAERIIVDRIRAAFPRHRIVAEESGLLDAADDSWVWLVDPLDGTNNVAIGLSNYVVGVALCRDGLPVLGVVHDPVRGESWSAIGGHGTRGPGGTVRPGYRMAEHPVLAWAQGYEVGRDNEAARALRVVLESSSRRVLQLWAPLLAWVMLARGDIDGFVGYRAEAIDFPAGSLIAREAGISVCGFDGEPFDERIDLGHDRSFVAGHPEAIPGLLELVRSAEGITIAGLPR
ncbi:inositol monophosphatase family protein [Amycolatopsis taiwanensis]|uniref:Inositol monophosphatase n=1 Tax=Amycolatopsis taiwanensis TaxID=342230 RepID=A0A9W6QXT6_9PSEU|nr:inositol monophosphatase [Amycolatopsis taiwanensis]GLY65703.1 inositol monophosphatase [Amycolatopsis taiwanensis]